VLQGLLVLQTHFLDQGIKTIQLPLRSPNLNAFAERWVRSVKQECLSKLIVFGPNQLWCVLSEYNGHYHQERNHQGASFSEAGKAVVSAT
jgi:transposase InsO family protein